MKENKDIRFTSSRIRLIAYWVTTGIIALETGVGSVWDIMKIPFVRTILEQLGYPSYMLTIMGVWKALGVVILLAPRFPRLKEWVYAGLVFVYSGAAASHLVIGHGADAVGPVIFVCLTIASWALRPPARRDFAPLVIRGEQGASTIITSSRGNRIAYWVTTALVVFQLGSGGIGDILRPSYLLEGMTHLGYPVYFCVILGVWKVLGALAILIPRYPRLKEWAYAGTIFDLTGAAASHFAIGDGAGKLVFPLLFTGITIASWALRPPARRDLAQR
ncbi:DoxX-like protein [Chitinophaga niastensis]|uniref:DoxX-like protein n=1 Tax=Chitinophaga niastensis TaxID=536980 RepID=A0A2P8HQ37_CHINA|nr:DoxX family protein [Chitinophaga niastensis]PSL48317.1 DoxX-like protein [Chitinophaga niastensis]